MEPETISALGTVAAASVSAIPAYLALRRARGAQMEAHTARTAVESEGVNTRGAVNTALDGVLARIDGRMDGLRDELRTDIREVRDWQTSHTAEHMLISTHRDQRGE